jgi:hypothetical protein
MREFELLIDQALKSGLAPELIPINSQFLYECKGFRCGKARLEPHIPLTNPLPAALSVYYSWPFPQFITGEKYNFLIIRDTVNQEDAVYLVSADHLTVTYIFSVDELTFGKGNLMEVADFGEYVFMTDGVCMIFWNPVTLSWQNIVSSSTIPLMSTVCNFMGQAVGGGVLSTWHDCDETFYLWSQIGHFDFTPEEDNEAGYRRDPFGGEVYHVKRLEDNVIGYSSKGIIRIYPAKSPAATMGFEELHDVGLINRGAMNGNLREHLFVDSDYNVWKVGVGVDVGGISIAKVNPKMLGYQTQMKQLAGEDIIVTYDPARGDFYIGNSIKTFLLSPYGMTEVLQHPSAVWRSNKVSYMLPEAVDVTLPTICTEPFDMEYGGQKTVVSVESDASVVDGPEAAVDQTYDNKTWSAGSFKPINNQGIAAITAAGNAFKFRLQFSDIYATTRISYLKVRYKMTDLRGIRGVYAPGIRGQQSKG